MTCSDQGTARASVLFLTFLLAGCVSSPRFATRTNPASDNTTFSLIEEGNASYYADEFNGHTTSNGETFNKDDLTAAHRTLPFNTTVKVTNLTNAKSIVVRINDRGPFVDDRIIDLSYEAAKRIGLILKGTARVRLEVVELGSGKPNR
ncbi:MAG: septal ring lytic transglycosylase RlpA family protein [Bacteroidota bacterium]